MTWPSSGRSRRQLIEDAVLRDVAAAPDALELRHLLNGLCSRPWRSSLLGRDELATIIDEMVAGGLLARVRLNVPDMSDATYHTAARSRRYTVAIGFELPKGGGG